MRKSVHPRAQAIYEEALALPRDARDAFLQGACAGDVGLRDEIDSMLSGRMSTMPLGADAAIPPAPLDDPGSPRGSGQPDGSGNGDLASLVPVPRAYYTLSEEIGHGGQGRIFAARDRRLGRDVAIKQLLAAGPQIQERFEREARITARLQHPGIVAVYEAGRFTTGEPFYAMRMISGRSLHDAIAETRTISDRLSLLPHLIDVAEALAYAHSLRVVHRDLKPDNVLLGPFGETVVIDWGLAKDLRPEALLEGAEEHDARRPSSQLGEVVGTPAYMAPEQANGEQVTERADVYAIGAILHHLLSGRPAYHGGDVWEVLKKVRTGPPPPLAERQSGVPPDLLAITAKAMARDPGERYPTAKELAEELKRFQTGQLVAARHYSRLDRLRRWIGRHRAAVLVGIAGAAVLVLGGTESMRRIVGERDLARRERELATARADDLVLVQARTWLDRDPAHSMEWLRSLSPGSGRWRGARIIAADALSRGIPRVLGGHDGAVTRAAYSPDGGMLVTASADRVLRLWDLGTRSSRALRGHQSLVGDVAFSPDGRHIASASHDGTVRLWRVADGTSRSLRARGAAVTTVVWSPRGDHVAAAGKDGIVVLARSTSPDGEAWDVEDRVAPSAVRHLAFSRDGGLLAAATEEGAVALWDLGGAKEAPRLLESHAGAVERVAFAAGSRLVSAGKDGIVRIWQLEDGELEMLRGHEQGVVDLAVSPDGRSIASAGDDRTIRIFPLEGGETQTLRGHERTVTRLAFSPDGSVLASASYDGTVRLWDLATGLSRRFLGHEHWVYDVAFSPGGRELVSAGADKTARIWSLGDPGSLLLKAHDDWVVRVLFTDAGAKVASLGQENTLSLWDSRDGALAFHGALQGTVRALHEGSGTMALAGMDGTLRVVPIASPHADAGTTLAGHQSDVLRAAFSPGGRSLASASVDGEVRVWELSTGEGRLLPGRCPGASDLAFSPDGETLVAAGEDHALHLYAVTSGERRTLVGHTNVVKQLVFSPDGRSIATTSVDRSARIWDVGSGQPRKLPGHDSTINHVTFSPDGRTLAGGGFDRLIHLWAVEDLAQRTLEGHEDGVLCVAFSPDGARLLSASADSTVRLWDVATGESRALRGHDGRVLWVAFSPEGDRLASAGKDGAVRIWPDDLPSDPARLLEIVASAAPEDDAPARASTSPP